MHTACIFHTHYTILERNRMQPLQDGYPDLTLVGMLSRAMQMTVAMTLWQAVMATHQDAGMWPLAGDEGRRKRGRGEGGRTERRRRRF